MMVTVRDKKPDEGAPDVLRMHDVDAVAAVNADPERYEIVSRDQHVSVPASVTDRLAAIEARLAALEAADDPAPEPDPPVSEPPTED